MAEQEDGATRSKRRCVFCGSRDLTKEHVWPAWLANVARTEARARHFSIAEVQEDVRKRTPFFGPPFQTTVRRVCGKCNHGWMNDLENAARPALTSMIQGRGRTLHRATRQTLGLWAWKTTLMFEFASSDSPREIPDEHYRWLYERRELPPRFHVWLAPYAGRRFITYYRRDALGLTLPDVPWPTKDADESNMYGATLGIGQLAIQLMTSFLPRDLALKHGPEYPVYKIWPADGGVTFYPRPALTDDGMLAFGEAFQSSAGPVTRHVA